MLGGLGCYPRLSCGLRAWRLGSYLSILVVCGGPLLCVIGVGWLFGSLETNGVNSLTYILFLHRTPFGVFNKYEWGDLGSW